MKRTMLVTLDFPPMVGGVANYWGNLNRHFESDNFVVLTQDYDNSLDFDMTQSYLIYRKNLFSNSKWFWPKWLPLLWETLKLVRQEKIKMLMCTHVVPVGTVCYILKKLIGVPYMVSVHGLDISLCACSKRKRLMVKRILRNAEKVIANSNSTKDILLEHNFCPADNVLIVYPCPNVNFEPGRESFLEKLRADERLKDKKIILTVARLIERKGQDRVIQSLPKILESVPNAVYLVVGRGAQYKYLQELTEMLKLQDKIMYYTDATDEELPGFYEICDVFAMPVRKLENGDVEGFGIVYLEANCYGKPVVAGRSGGAVEAVEDGVNGLLVDPQSINEIADAIVRLLKNPVLAHGLGEAGRLRVAEKFNWHEQAMKIVEILK
jgi:phosphatidylinositol alpha-1,6-mannosyltransferase